MKTKTNKTNRLITLTGMFLTAMACMLMQEAVGQAVVTQTFTTNGTFNVPTGVTSITIECWGGGGAGGGAQGNPSGGGGGAGGAYSKKTLSGSLSSSYTVTVGGSVSGSTNTGSNGNPSWFGSAATVFAEGGQGGGRSTTNNNSASGGTASDASSIGDNTNKGGNGGTGASGNSAGGGGEGAGAASDGNAGGVTTGGSGLSDGGDGGAGGSTSGNGGNGSNGSAPGGGGGGGRAGNNNDRSGGTGSRGQVIVSYTPLYASLFVSMNTGAATWCAGETRNVTVTVTNNGSASWTDGGGQDFNVGCKWNADPDYLIRTDVQNLAPGATQTFTLTMTAPTTAGSNNLAFDIVKEGDCWFGGNGGSCGPGNSAFTSPAITIAPLPQISAFSGNTVCGVGTGQLTATLNAGTGPFSIIYDPGATLKTGAVSGTPFNASPNPVSTTTYTVTSITDGNGCVRTSGFTDDQATITVSTVPIVGISGTTSLDCNTPSTVLTATGGGTYLWSTGAVSAATATLTPAVTTNYTVTVTTNGCTATQSIAVNVDKVAPAAVSVSGAGTFCNGTTLTATGGAPGIIYYQTTTSNGTSTATATSTAAIASSGTYYFRAQTASNGCWGTQGSAAVIINNSPTTSGETICQGDNSITGLIASSACTNLTGQTSGAINAGTGANVAIATNTDWSNPGNITPVGTPYATSTFANGTNTDYLQATNYNFSSIPNNAIINGIQVVINRNGTQTATVGVRDDAVYMVKDVAGTPTIQTSGGNKAHATTWPTSFATDTYGGSSDLWNLSWSASDIKNSNFGVVLSAHNNSGFSNRTATVDYLQITITYTIPGSIEWFTASSGGSSVQSGTPFFPVNDAEVIAAGGAYANLNNTNTPGTYTFYAECTTNPIANCRTATNFIISAAPTASCSHTDVSCAGATDGTASVAAGAGNGIFTYLWSDGGAQTTATATGLGVGTYTVTVTSNGCTATCSTTVGNGDVTPPTITCPSTVTVNNDAGICTGTVAFLGTPTPTDNCGISSTVNNHPSNTYSVGNTTVTWTTTDTNGNTATCTQTVTVTDVEVPTITCPNATTIGTDDGHCYTEASFGTPFTIDNCGVFSITDDAPAQLPTGVHSITWTVTDVNGLTNTCIQSVTVVDDEAPGILCPNHVTVNADAGQCFATGVNLGSLTFVGDNCSGIGTPTNNGLLSYPVGTTPVTWTVVDAAGNSSSCNHNVIVIDNQPPTITCPPTVTYSCFAGIPAAAQDLTQFVSAGGSVLDNCGGLTVGHVTSQYITPPTLCDNQFVFYREYMVTDGGGLTASCQQVITIHDNVVPVITNCPANTTINCEDAMPSPAGLAFTDGCNPTTGTTPAAVVTDNGIACYSGRIVTYTWTATDQCGNTAQCVQTISFNADVTAPVITPVNSSANIGCNPSPAAIEAALGSATAMDNCSGNITVQMVQSTGNAVNTGGCNWSVTRTWSVTDACNNVATPVSVTVSYSVVTAPVISGAPTGGFIGVNPNVLPVCGVATAINECGTVPVTCTPGMIMSNGCNRSQQFVYQATDVCSGLSATPVNVNYTWTEDVTPPTFNSCPSNLVLDCGTSLPPNTGIGFNDLCSGPGTTSSANVIDNNPSCISGRIVTYTWTAIDAYGNSAQCVQTITFNPDVTGPVFSGCPSNLVLNCGDALPPVASPTAMDACSGAAFVSYNGQTQNNPLVPVSCPTDIIYTRTWTATDMCGNNTICTQTISFNPDVTPPVITSCPSNITLNCGSPLPPPSGLMFMDGCSGPGTTPPATVNDNGATCITGRVVTYTWTATDLCNNTSQCVQTITFNADVTGPVFNNCPVNVVLNCGDALPTVATPTATDACSGPATVNYNGQTQSFPTVGCPTDVVYTRTWTATDACGNTTLCSQTISYNPDVTPPVITSCPSNITLNCGDALPPTTGLAFNDACSGASVTPPAAVNDNGATCITGRVVTYTWTATDLCNNTSQCVQTITFNADVTGPVFNNCPAAVVLNCGDALPPVATPTATDACSGAATVVYNGETQNNPVVPVSCPTDIIYTRTWTATDACGNTTLCSQTISYNPDVTPPVISSCPSDITLNCGDALPPTTGLAFTDACSGASVTPPAAVNDNGATCITNRVVTYTWTATDLCNNSVQCVQTITFNADVTGPVFSGCPTDVLLNCGDALPPVATPTAMDACSGAATVNYNGQTQSFITVGCLTDIIYTRTWTATDACGNSTLCTQTISYNPDLTQPTITFCPASVSVPANNSGCTAINVIIGTATATDNCGIPAIANDAPTTFSLGSTIVIWTATDDCGNTATCTQTVTVTNAATASITETDNSGSTIDDGIICEGGSASLTASGGVSYSWNPNIGNGAGPHVVSPISNTIYSVTATDANGCTATATYEVVVNPLPTPVIVVTETSGLANDNIMCFGNTAVLSTSVPYISYQWTDGNATGTLATFNGTVDGIYTVTVTDANGCTASATTQITIYNPVQISFIVVPVDCFGELTGEIDIDVMGGSGNYNTYVWSSGQSTEDISGVAAGFYTVTVSDNYGCSASGSIQVQQPLMAVLANCSGTNISCNGASDGTAAVIASGGTAPYSYTWDDINATEADNISGLSAGTYCVIIVDANGCSATCCYTVTEPAILTANCSGTDVTCNSGTNGSATVTPGGGTAPYTYLWNDASSSTTSAITGLAAGMYCVTVTDANGCEEVCCYTVTQPAPYLASISGSLVVPNGGTTTLTANTSSGYLWSTGSTMQSIVAGVGTYTVTVINNLGCTGTASVEVIESPTPVLVCSSTDVTCKNGGDGTVSVSVNGGTPGYTYSWSNGNTNASQSGLIPGSYTVLVTDNNSATASCVAIITQPATALIANGVVTHVTCKGGSDGQIDVTATGGTSPYTYLWNNGSSMEDRTNLTAGVYSVTVTDAHNCVVNISFAVSQPSRGMMVSMTKSNIRCGGKSSGSASAIVTGGVGVISYMWNTGNTTSAISNVPYGIYTVSVTDANGCVATKSVNIIQNPPLLVLIIPGPGSATANVSGGVPAYTYLWNTVPYQTTATATGLILGSTYKVKVTDSKNCTYLATITLAIPRSTDMETDNFDVNLYPNPTDGIVNLNFKSEAALNYSLNLYDATGRLMMSRDESKTSGSNSKTYDFSSLPKGIYLLKINSEIGSKILRVVLQ